MQQEQSSPHQQGSLTPGVMRLIAAFEEEEVADEEDEGVERAVLAWVLVVLFMNRYEEEVGVDGEDGVTYSLNVRFLGLFVSRFSEFTSYLMR
jgi:hypothetical protein